MFAKDKHLLLLYKIVSIKADYGNQNLIPAVSMTIDKELGHHGVHVVCDSVISPILSLQFITSLFDHCYTSDNYPIVHEN